MLKTVFTSPKLEYVRLWIPQPIYLGLYAFVVSMVIAFAFYLLDNPTIKPLNATEFIVLAFHILANPTKQLNETEFWVIFLTIPFIASIGCTIIFYIIRFIGWLSGYRPYSTPLEFRDKGNMVQFEKQLKTRIQDQGFELFWENPRKGFIGVRGIELEREGGFAITTETFPIRCVYLRKTPSNTFNRFEGTLKLEHRAIMVWDTGETAVLRKLGKELLHDLK